MTDVNTDIEVPKAVETLSKGKSMQDIADMLAQNTMAMRGQQPSPNEGDEDATDATGEADATDLDTGGDGADAEDAGDIDDDAAGSPSDGVDEDTGEGGEAEDADADADGGDPEPDAAALEFEIDDSDLLELDDGSTVSIADLKQLYQSDETIGAAIQEQQQATNDALTMRARAQEDFHKSQGAINAMMKHIVDVVAAPLIGPPDEALKTTNPEQYIRHLEAYNQDQQRIQQAQQDLSGAIGAYSEQQQQQLETRKKEEMGVLISKIPALQSEQTRPQASQDILDASKYYGFSPEEVNNAIDHRVYQMAYDAQQYRKLMAATGKEEVDLTLEKAKTKVKQTRTLRSRGTTAKSRVSGQAKRVLTAKKKAAASGKAADVAAYLAAKRRKP